MGDLHCRMDTEEVRGVMMPVSQFETDKTDQSQRQQRPPPELKLPGTLRWNLGHGARVGNASNETRPRIAVLVTVLTANRDITGEIGKYNGF